MQAYVIIVLLLWVSVALQGAWPVWLRAGGQPPDFLVAAITCVGLVRGASDGCLAGLLGAVLLAGATHTPLGGLSLAYMLVGAGFGQLRGSLFVERLLVAAPAAGIAVLVASLIRVVFTPPPEFLVWVRVTFYSALMTVPIAPAVYAVARLARKREGML